MAWEDVPADVDAFFQTGELPKGSGDEPAPAETVTPTETPVETAASVETADTPPAEPSTVTEPAPQAPTNPYAEELIRQQQATLDRLTKQLADMQKAQADAAAEANKPAPIDPEKDPLGYLTQQIKAVGDQVEAMKTAQTQAQQETAQQ